MKESIRWYATGAILASCCLFGQGCQTYEVGQVLPSPHHMLDDVQYFPKGPRFPLANELNAMQSAEAEQTGEFH